MIVLVPATSWFPSIVIFACPAASWDGVPNELPFAVSATSPVGAAPRLVVSIYTVSVKDATDGIELLDALAKTLVLALTTLIGTAALVLAL